MIPFLPTAGTTIELRHPDAPGDREAHVFRQEDVDAIEAALLSERPLLVRGEPGVGKTQFALAAAVALRRGYCQAVVDSRTEVRDLRWTEDLVARLADAQLVGTLGHAPEAAIHRARLDDIANYVRPGPLWWAFDWAGAERQPGAVVPVSLHADCDPANGAVVLIDEIDKAEPDLPNGLLEALGSRRFAVRDRAPVSAKIWPLVVITTNEERELPAAFVRRCVVHDIRLPPTGDALVEFLVDRGRSHFPKAAESVLRKAAELTVQDRQAAEEQGLRPLPGQAEYLDLLRAAFAGSRTEAKAAAAVDRLSPYFLRKHQQMRRP